MSRIDAIIRHPVFIGHMEKNEAAEQGRIFCRHDMGHLLDVARIAMLLNLEEGLGLTKELLYGAALLHDIGRYRQYEAGIPNEEASASLADEILPECSFSEEEQAQIRDAILGHRRKEAGAAKGSSLAELLCRADKLSRNCFACAVREACNWPKDKMNMGIRD